MKILGALLLGPFIWIISFFIAVWVDEVLSKTSRGPTGFLATVATIFTLALYGLFFMFFV